MNSEPFGSVILKADIFILHLSKMPKYDKLDMISANTESLTVAPTFLRTNIFLGCLNLGLSAFKIIFEKHRETFR